MAKNKKPNDNDERQSMLGSSGAGKRAVLRHMIQQDVEKGAGLVIIDPEGDLYEYVLKITDEPEGGKQ